MRSRDTNTEVGGHHSPPGAPPNVTALPPSPAVSRHKFSEKYNNKKSPEIQPSNENSSWFYMSFDHICSFH